ncbi:GNAT family N-acetyltransferase [Nocardioides litoris]|uniref:GNAT family N-acetyltransferase n=1 Tax=Nocardioides litoris TaxID=1926648 RepID=UPI001FE4DD7C|nr:GNAT family N-acetyltransferase [Nocardioides litoris]
MTDLPLPPGCTARPLTLADTRAVYEVHAAQETHDVGRPEIEEADVVSDWQRPSFDVATSTVGVLEGDRLVACAELNAPERAEVAVHPDHRGRGLGTWLSAWARDLARSRGARIVGGPVPQGSAGDRLLTELGYHVRWTSWVLKLPEGATVPDRPLPDGYAVRAAEPDELPAAHDVMEDAFLEWSERERETWDDFTARTTGRPGHEPWHVRVVLDGDGTVVGAAVLQVFEGEGEHAGEREAYIARLATRADQRGRGLAQALMVDTFRVAREHGVETCGLSTDSRTGALGLYEKVGMVVTSTWVHRAVTLT